MSINFIKLHCLFYFQVNLLQENNYKKLFPYLKIFFLLSRYFLLKKGYFMEEQKYCAEGTSPIEAPEFLLFFMKLDVKNNPLNL